MKAKTTRGQMYRIYGKENIICLGYCENQRLIARFTPRFYTCGVYGWNADIYDFGSFAICTGYRPFGNESKDLRNICDKYEKRLSKATPRGKKLGFIIDFGKIDMSCFGGNGSTTYSSRERCINLLLAFLDCKISEEEIIKQYMGERHTEQPNNRQ